MKPYRLMEENDSYFLVHDGESQFKVAKRDLSPALAQRIQHFAAGGEVPDFVQNAMQGTIFNLDALNSVPAVAAASPVAAPPPGIDPAAPPLSAFSFEMPDQAPLPAAPAADAGRRLSAEDLAILNGQPVPAPTPTAPATVPMPSPTGRQVLPVPVSELSPDQRLALGIDQPVLAPQQVAPAGPAPAPAPAPSAASAAPPPAPGPSPGQGDKQIEAGLRAQAEAVKAQAAAELKLREQQEAQRQTLVNEYNRRLTEYQARGDTLFNNIMAQKLDPNRLWNQRTTGQKLGSIAAIIMSGIGQGLQAQAGINAPNMAMRVMDQAIERDIDAQKADIAKGQSLLAHHAQGGRDMAAAYQLTKADMLDGFAGQLQRNATQFAGQKADADVQLAIGQARERAAQLRAEAATRDFDRWYKMQQIAVAKAEAEAKAKDAGAELLVPGHGQALDQKSAGEARERVAAHGALIGDLDELIALRKQYNSETIPGEIKERMQSLGSSVLASANLMYKFGALDKGAKDELQNMIGDPTGFGFQGARMEQFKRSADRRLRASLRSYMDPRSYKDPTRFTKKLEQ